MTQEEKQILLKDLCARLPYGVKILGKNPITKEDEVQTIDTYKLGYFVGSGLGYRVDVVRPFLRLMSSMAEEEKEEYSKVCELDTEILSKHPMDETPFPALYNSQDWLNAHHFDYRGLIEKGLAIEVTEENNPYARKD